MKLFSVTKLVVVAAALCSASVFDASAISELSSDDPLCQRYIGDGEMANKGEAKPKHSYMVMLTVRKLGNGRQLLDYDFIRKNQTTYQTTRRPLIIEKKDDTPTKVLIPASKDKMNLYYSYKQAGWLHQLEYEQLHEDEGTPKKRSLLFNYLDMDGNRVTHHVFADKIDGKWQLTSTGSVVGDYNELLTIWTHKLVQVDVVDVACPSPGRGAPPVTF